LLTYEDWLQLPDDGRLYELIDGELFVSPSPNIRHQRVSRDLEFLLLTYLRRTGKGEVLDAPVGVRLARDTVLEPDILVVLREHAGRVGEQVIDGPPDLVVEVLSPGTARRDVGIKREKYRSSGVPEYWIVDPVHASIEVLALDRGEYVRHGLFGRTDTLRSKVLDDFEVALSEVFAAK
jgi:Uma2 family endonuclease